MTSRAIRSLRGNRSGASPAPRKSRSGVPNGKAHELPVAFTLPRSLPIPLSGFGPLMKALRGDVRALDWESGILAAPEVPVNYSLGAEVVRIKEEADSVRAETIHLFAEGDGGGIALAFAMRYPHRVASLVLIDPVPVGPAALNQLDIGRREDLNSVLNEPNELLLETFIRQSVAEQVADGLVGLVLPKTVREAPLLAARYRASVLALARYPPDYGRFKEMDAPSYVAVGGLSHPRAIESARFLSRQFHTSRLEVFEGLHPFDPPHWAATARVAEHVREMWGWETGPKNGSARRSP